MSTDAVLLLHGLWMNGATLLFLSRRLARAGFAPHRLGYASVRRDLSDHIAVIARALDRIDAARIHVVAHSMGGVVALAALGHVSDPRIGRVVVLGAPLNGCRVGRVLAERAGWRMLLGSSAAIWSRPPALAVPRGVEVAAIAGTRRIGFGRLLVAIEGVNDGVVTLEETRLAGLAAHLVLPVSHSTMLLSPRVARATAHFLHHGRFDDEA